MRQMLTHNLAHSIRLYPTESQEIFFRKACGCARAAYNYGLAEYQKQRKEGGKPKISEIKKKFNQEKKILYPWMYETNKDANQHAAINLRNYALEKLGVACPEITPVDTGALTHSSSIGVSETAVDEAGIYQCSEMST